MTRELSSIYIVGTDEAGYGPNLGPLVVGASSWRLDAFDASFAPANWRETFLRDATAERQNDVTEPSSKKRGKKKRAVASGPTLFELEEPAQESSSDAFVQNAIDRLNASLAPICSRKGVLPLVDSKKLYASKSLAALERSFWLAQAIRKRRPLSGAPTFAQATRAFDLDRDDYAPPWEQGEYVNLNFPMPVDPKSGDDDKRAELAQGVEKQFDAARVALLDAVVRRVQPLSFNRLLDRLGLKSDLIADVTTSLAVEAIERVLSFEPNATSSLFVLLCDKLGGRDRYGAVLAARFPDAQIQTLVEARDVGVYRLEAERARGRDGRLVEFGAKIAMEIRFTAKGESNVSTALASICAKYFRELSMIPFNEYWRSATNDPTLRSTAGYPVDALRFRADVDDARKRLAIGDEEFWRKK